MLGYVTLGTNDMQRARAFYDAIAEIAGTKRSMDGDSFCSWGGMGTGGCSLGVIKPHDGKPATVGNGVMPAIQVKTKEQVEKLHAKALELGGEDEGAVGFRGDSFYAGYFRDPDGNKLAVFTLVMADSG